MRKILKWAVIAAIVLFLLYKTAWEVLKNYMGKLENNMNCTFYSEEEYARKVEWVTNMIIPEPVNPFPVRITFDLNGLPAEKINRVMFNHNTPPITPPSYQSMEYVGPYQQTMDFLLSDTRNEWPFSFHPSIGLYFDDEQAICFWDGGEDAEYIQDGRGHPHFNLELLPYRKVEKMSGYNLKLIK